MKLLCRLGLHRRYYVQRNFNAHNQETFRIRLCRRHCGWTDVGPNYGSPESHFTGPR